ncbi:hypothetical protein ACFT9I_27190 [Streptomyces sp. NPDC057137]|uniref:hypothetical protein n=1 Tax=Streptomyces sp. NPDC057137 TaxID=3346030 RepID=UPI00362898A7
MDLIFSLLGGCLLGGVFVLWDKAWVRREEAKERQQSIQREAMDTYITMRDRKHDTMRQMRDIARDHRNK